MRIITSANDLVEVLYRIKDSVIAVDNNFNIIYANKSHATIFSLQPNEMIGQNLWQIAPKILGTIMEQKLYEAKAKQDVLTFEWLGSYSGRIMETTLFPSKNGITGVSRDITARKNTEVSLKESKELFSAAFHRSPAALTLVSLTDNCIVDVNQVLLDLFEYKREEVLGRTAKELEIFPDFSEREKIVKLLIEKGNIHNQEIRSKTKTGKLLQCLDSLELITINGKKHFLVSIIDITEIKNLQIKLQEYSKDLEKLVEHRTKQLKDSERLAAIGQTAGMVGHDIRNPLQSIIGETFLLKEEVSEISDTGKREIMLESLDSIEKNIAYINKIVADLQDFARPLMPEYCLVDVASLFDEVIKTANIPKNIKVTVATNTFKKINTDPTLLRRTLTNLVNNAIQAMPNGGELELTFFAVENTEIITVTDTGMGIPDKVKPTLFTPMLTTKAKGQGLGLAVAKRLVETLNGTINFESQEGKGTKFIIKLPYKE